MPVTNEPRSVGAGWISVLLLKPISLRIIAAPRSAASRRAARSATASSSAGSMAGSRRSTLPRMIASTLLKSCAMPAVISPTATILWAWRTAASSCCMRWASFSSRVAGACSAGSLRTESSLRDEDGRSQATRDRATKASVPAAPRGGARWAARSSWSWSCADAVDTDANLVATGDGIQPLLTPRGHHRQAVTGRRGPPSPIRATDTRTLEEGLMNLTLWIVTGFLAAAYLIGGLGKLIVSKERIAAFGAGAAWVEDFSA